jgi:hypothetical protein
MEVSGLFPVRQIGSPDRRRLAESTRPSERAIENKQRYTCQNGTRLVPFSARYSSAGLLSNYYYLSFQTA